MKKLIYIIILLLVIPSAVSARKKKKVEPEAQKSRYEKLLEGADSTNSAKGDFVSLYRLKEKLYVEMPVKLMGRSVLIGSCVAESSNSQVAMAGYKYKDPLHISFELQDSTVLMKRMTNSVLYDGNYNLAIQRSYQDPIIRKFTVKAFSKDSASVVFDMTDFFITDNELITPIAQNVSILKVKATYKKELAKLSTVRSFHDNASVSSRMSYDYTMTLLGTEVMKGELTAKVTFSMLLLPEKIMKPRISDSRVGVFLTEKREFDTEHDGMRFISLAHRWRLQPKDTLAWLRGEPVEVNKPIVWYVDDAFPQEWKEPLKRSVTRWNEAFEKIGLKNVMQARSFPTKEEDPNFDPNNLAYSCIRYVPIPVQNAQGPSWVDPRSGEIINASVMVYNDVVRLINNWLFVQTAQLDTAVRHSKMPKEVMDDALTYVFSHEIGHTLGLMHNMGASSSFPVDSLRSPSFTQKYGTTPSIMDYARWNYVAQPQDKGVRLSPPDMGIYDEFAIKWLYSPIVIPPTPNTQHPTSIRVEQEQEVLEKWVDEKADDPRYRYGRQQILARYDPTSIEEDLGDDPIKAGDYGISNLKYILAHMSDWIGNDSSYSHRQELYKRLVSQFTGYLNNTLEVVGGIKLTSVKEGSKALPHESMPGDKQHKAIEWVVKQLRNCQWIDCPELTRHFPMALNTSVILNNSVGRQMLSRTNNVLLSTQVARQDGYSAKDVYTQQDYFNDLYTLIWQPTIQGKALTQGDRLLQRALVSNCAAKVATFSGTKKLCGTTVDDIVVYGLDPTGYVEKHAQELRKLDDEHGQGFVASLLPEKDGCGCSLFGVTTNSFGEGQEYGFQPEVSTDIIDESKSLYLGMLRRIETLLKSKLTTANAIDKVHYQAMMQQLKGSLSN